MPSKKPKGPAHHVERIKKAIAKEPKTWSKHLAKLREMEHRTRRRKPFMWDAERTYHSHYTPFFGPALGSFFGAKGHLTIAQALEHIPRGKRRFLRVVEDGPGTGNALEGIKSDLVKKGISVHTTALAFEVSKGSELEARVKSGAIDRIVTGPAEFFLPKKPVHAIISLYGSLHYAPTRLRKEHLLKFSQSLAKGGIMLVGFDPKSNLPKYKALGSQPEGKILQRRVLQDFLRAFKKRGFKAELLLLPQNLPSDVRYRMPSHILIIQRTNIQPTKK